MPRTLKDELHDWAVVALTLGLFTAVGLPYVVGRAICQGGRRDRR